MKVYADILFILNLAVDYFLLRTSGFLLKRSPSFLRLILAAFSGGIFSFYIFFPQSPIFLEILIKTLMCFITVFIAFGFKNYKIFLRTAAIFTALTFAYGGINIMIWYILKPVNLIINNSVVYYGISPLVLILSSVTFYFSAFLIQKLFGKTSTGATRCQITIFAEKNAVTLNGILDTGNNLCDSFGDSAVIIADKTAIDKIFSGVKKTNRLRVIPCKTVGGNCLLNGYRADKVLVGNTTVKSPVIAQSKTPISEDEAILNPLILER